MKYKAIVIGGSAGAFEALEIFLVALPKNFILPILIVQHLHPDDEGAFAGCFLKVLDIFGVQHLQVWFFRGPATMVLWVLKP